MILLIDNYDSFTYNLYQQIGILCPDIAVARNDEITLDEIEALSPQALVISPGPCYPQEAGVSVAAVQRFSGRIPILGVCLGHQAIAAAFGGKIIRARRMMHGKASEIQVNTSSVLFAGMPEKLTVGRYHSLVADSVSLPSCLSVTATDGEGQIMALRHRDHLTFGVQFHPESILTRAGDKLVANFLELAGIALKPVEVPFLPPEKRVALKKYLAKVVDGRDLSEQEAYQAMDVIMGDQATDAQIAAFMTALRVKGETVPEITGFARVMRERAKTVANGSGAVDIVGTGGDLSGSFNISTTAAFVIAGAGQPVAKHGNRSVSSKSGAADVLEALGVRIATRPEQAGACLEQVGLTFLFAQNYHGSMKYAAPARRETGIRTVFNILGPLSNPAKTGYIVLGVYDEKLLEPMAKVLMNLGVKGAMLVHGGDGLDEASISGPTQVCEIRDGILMKYELSPEKLGLPLGEKQEVSGGLAKDNAEITVRILSGKEQGAPRNIVLLNAACALYITGRAKSLQEGVALAAESVDSGRALAKLEALKAFTNQM